LAYRKSIPDILYSLLIFRVEKLMQLSD
jgi:hypothetical protein